MIYLSGHRLLEDSDNRLNWNLLTETNLDFKDYVIPKNKIYPGQFILSPVPFTGTLTFSAFIENDSDQAIYLRGDGNTNRSSDPVNPHSCKRLFVTNEFNDNGGLWYSVQSANDTSMTANADMHFKVKEVKLEFGNIATPWMPSLSDLVFKNQNGGVWQPANPLVSMLYVPSEMEVA